MTVGRYLKLTGLLILIPAGILSFPLYRFAGVEVAGAAAAGSALAALGALIWLGCLLRGWGRGQKTFLGYFVGGIFLRFLLFGAATVGAVLSPRVHLPTFLGSLLVFIVLFQILEIRFTSGLRQERGP